MRSAMRSLVNSQAGASSAYQRAGSVPGGNQRYVGMTPVAGGGDWVDAPIACSATTHAGEPCKKIVTDDPSGMLCQVHRRAAAPKGE